MLAAQSATIVELQTKVNERDSEVLHLSTWVEKLKIQIAVLKRLRFGRSSEKLDQEIIQLELIVDELEAQQGEHQQAHASPDDVELTVAPEPAVQRARKLMPDHLPRQVVNHAPACSCPTCGGNHLRLVGETVSEQLELIPEHFKVIRHVRGKYSCTSCQTMVQAPAPSRPLIKSPVAPGLLAHVLVSKYMDHLPQNRQSEIYARQGVELDRATLTNWVGGASALLRPLIQALQMHTLGATKIHADDTPVPVLQPGRKTTKEGRIWAYVRDDRNSNDPTPPSVWVAYSPDRKGVHPQKHLKDFKGIIQSDGYKGYNKLYEKPEINEAACWGGAGLQAKA
jgi:transposase